MKILHRRFFTEDKVSNIKPYKKYQFFYINFMEHFINLFIYM
jgi:hypothetical protein